MTTAMKEARKRIEMLTGSNKYYKYWVGETGWSFPQPKTLGTEMASCRAWNSLETFERFYRGFLNWTMLIPDGYRAPDHIFYFSVRTSLNFGFPEYFGLIDQCNNVTCKIKTENYTEPKTLMQEHHEALQRWRTKGFIGVGVLVLGSLIGSVVYVTLLPSAWKSRTAARKLADLDLQDMASSSSSEDST
eukprot:CAMPEP_0175784896 /NCGR_PEP_ID=MMETSP0097-20121207/79049_1 /TAXON_ID=311494 /ORGANISM="Alexandrium monilatum, Strain CCMP3105" /LENGTH=188 /DNA_ID=CAMNT_0017095791 /DNA_START=170 /DNA_END=736 /DNA_ORIENTATION=-